MLSDGDYPKAVEYKGAIVWLFSDWQSLELERYLDERLYLIDEVKQYQHLDSLNDHTNFRLNSMIEKQIDNTSTLVITNSILTKETALTFNRATTSIENISNSLEANRTRIKRWQIISATLAGILIYKYTQ